MVYGVPGTLWCAPKLWMSFCMGEDGVYCIDFGVCAYVFLPLVPGPRRDPGGNSEERR
ncbi:hypothetical protein O181_128756, partial [Austropuccinia psidii MF-1]|nr:hypothetical protein [Austropuccinia psidii MF-1]